MPDMRNESREHSFNSGPIDYGNESFRYDPYLVPETLPILLTGKF
jgi:hypothetical protein